VGREGVGVCGPECGASARAAEQLSSTGRGEAVGRSGRLTGRNGSGSYPRGADRKGGTAAYHLQAACIRPLRGKGPELRGGRLHTAGRATTHAGASPMGVTWQPLSRGEARRPTMPWVPTPDMTQASEEGPPCESSQRAQSLQHQCVAHAWPTAKALPPSSVTRRAQPQRPSPASQALFYHEHYRLPALRGR